MVVPLAWMSRLLNEAGNSSDWPCARPKASTSPMLARSERRVDMFGSFVVDSSSGPRDGYAAVDQGCGARDESGIVGREVKHRAGQLFRRSDALERVQVCDEGL